MFWAAGVVRAAGVVWAAGRVLLGFAPTPLGDSYRYRQAENNSQQNSHPRGRNVEMIHLIDELLHVKNVSSNPFVLLTSKIVERKDKSTF